MIKLGNFIVVLDANILYQAPIRDLLLRLAESPAEMFQVRWSEEIVEEATRNLIKDNRMDDSQAASFKNCLYGAFEDAYVDGYKELIPVLENNENDRHVLAVAIIANAQVIVTLNIKHFPEEALKKYNIEAQTPDTFLLYLYDLSLSVLIETLQKQQQELTNPPLTQEEFLNNLAKSAPEFINKIRKDFELLENTAHSMLEQDIEISIETYND